MSKELKFCPNCGAELKGAKFCPECGTDANKEASSSPKSISNTEAPSKAEIAKGNSNAIWNFVGPYMKEIGKYQWIVCLIVCGIRLLVYLFAGIPFITLGVYDLYVQENIWDGLIKVIILVVLILIWVKPKFSSRLEKEQFDVLLKETVQIGSIKIPMMLIMGVVMTIIGWGESYAFGALVLLPALLIIFFGPIPYKWDNSEPAVKKSN
jgi:hypothetical protein